MDFTKALTYPFEDNDWLKKLLFLLIAGIIPIIGNPIAVQGWAVETARNVRAGKPAPLADWDDIGGVIGRGFPLFLASLVYNLPVILLYCIGFGATAVMGGAASGLSDDTSSGAAVGLTGMILPCCLCIAFLYAIAAAVVYLGGYMRFLDKPEFGTFMEFGENFALVQANIGDIGMAILYIIGAGVLASIVSSITFGIAGLVAMPFLGYFSAHIVGQLAAKIGGGAVATAPQV